MSSAPDESKLARLTIERRSFASIWPSNDGYGLVPTSPRTEMRINHGRC